MQIIEGRDIQVGDVIRSAAMRREREVKDIHPSSTGNTVEVRVEGEYVDPWYRIGVASKVRLYSRIEEIEEER